LLPKNYGSPNFSPAMRTTRSAPTLPRAMTLIELSVVIVVLLSLLGLGLYSMGGFEKWKLGRAASESLRSVYAAQRTYLADHPTEAVGSLTDAKLLPYMPGTPDAMPTVTSLNATELT